MSKVAVTAVVPESRCSTCGKVHDRATTTQGIHTPKPGDIGVCNCCGEVHRYDDQLKLVQASLNDIMALSPEQRQMIGQMQKSARRRR